MLSVDGWDRQVVEMLPRYRTAAQNVLRSLNRPDRAIGQYGWMRTLRNEILPLTFTPEDGGGAWVPNYEFHLLGSGMVSARMTEWYAQRGMPHPGALSFVTMTASHFMNEVVENAMTPRYYDSDAVIDLYLFDTGGFLLFRNAGVRRFFSETVQLTNWPGQPTWVEPGGTLENTGQLFILRGHVPFVRGLESWRWMYGFGVTSLFGITRDAGSGYGISAAAGIDAVDVVVLDSVKGTKTVKLRPTGGVFLDREGSLLVSVMKEYGRGVKDYGSDANFSINVYPGVVRVPGVGMPGMWVHSLRGGGIRIGVVSRAGLGLGVVSGRR